MLLAHIIAFELKKRARLLGTYVFAVCFFAAGFLFMNLAGGAFESATVEYGGKVLINSAFSLANDLALLTYFGVGVLAGVMARAAAQDFEAGISQLFFTTPMGKVKYVLGRYLGAVVSMAGIYAFALFGLAAGTKSPWIDAGRVGANHFAAYARPFLVITLVDVVALGAIFFSVALLARRAFPAKVASVVLLIGYLIGLNASRDVDDKYWAALLDPFGTLAQGHVTQYWTVVEKNTLASPLEGSLLTERLVWLGAGLLVLVLTTLRFAFIHGEGGKHKPEAADQRESAALRRPQIAQRARGAFFLHLPRLAWLEFKASTRNPSFVVLAFAGVLTIVATSRTLGSMYGTTVHPVTHAVLWLAKGSFGILWLAITAFLAGELVWRERDARMNQLIDASPVPTWLLHATKLGALLMTQVLLLFIVGLTAVAIQLSQGYFNIELSLYATDLFGVELPDLFALSALALLVHALVNEKYVGHFVMVLYYVATIFFDKLGLEHHLYQYGSAPSYTYSDMNGYGHAVAGLVWFKLYWGLCALLLALVSQLFWQRGVQSELGGRMRLVRERLTPRVRAGAALLLAAFIASGSFIFYNTNRLNRYRTEFEQDALLAAYEKTYKAWADKPQPRIEEARISADIHPSRRALDLSGTLRVRNRAESAISSVLLNVRDDAEVRELAFESGSRIEKRDLEDRVYLVSLTPPLAPGAETALRFDFRYASSGFSNDEGNTELVENGTFFHHDYAPIIGYQSGAELRDDDKRKKHGLTPKDRMLDLDDPAGRARNYISNDADWIDFEATVSTDPDQIALAPGYLQREWSEGGRRYFHYKMDRPILHFYAFVSARYQVARDTWNDLPIEVYYHPAHNYNVAGMIDATKAALEYCTAQFSPYQHKQVRIIEFPRYQTYAQSFPNTIPYSEAVGFIAKVDPSDEEDVDYPYYITAHEIAHQWWAHQVIGANVQGSTLMSESLAQYTALRVMRKKYGDGHMRRFFKHELDHYLTGRALERKRELPLVRVENQPYVHYQKGGIVLYALADYIGEDRLNSALKKYLAKTAFQGPPYTTARELVAALREETPADLQHLIDDWFEHVTLYDLRATSATYSKRADGKFEVSLDVYAKKFHAGELGEETPVPVREQLEIGVFDAKGEALYLEKHTIAGEQARVSVVVDREPHKAGVDPLNKLIDRKPNDNQTRTIQTSL